MRATETSIPGVLILEPTRHVDERGSFTELFNLDTLESMGVDDHFVQENLAVSVARGTIRGLHAQAPPEPQAKLVRVARGAIFDVAVDLRVGSTTHGEHVAVELDAFSGRQLYVPTGLLHGYCTLTDDTEVAYWVAGRWRPELEFGVRWDDPSLGIDWPVDAADVVLSERDRTLPYLPDIGFPFAEDDAVAESRR